MTVSFVEFFVEEPSAEAALRSLVPKILGEAAFDVHAFAGKPELLQRLPQRLRGYSKWIPEGWRIVVLLDEDREDCLGLKRTVERMAREAGLGPKPPRRVVPFRVLTRLAVEELEAWYFGDVAALRVPYPRVPATLGRKAKFRDPDAIKGGTWEQLEGVLQQAGYHKGGLAKIRLARDVAPHMAPQHNRSNSFQVFRDGLLALRSRPDAIRCGRPPASGG
ncbi:MAG: DUF4276 family protein [Myxococcota bacterium]|nr:DUF4276 family protein [Myxococcota bacterium]